MTFASGLAAAPARVVSINLCTDQLAMLLAAPGQLLSVSQLAVDPRASVMAKEAKGYRLNRGSAEDIYLMRPDLVLAGTYTTRFTVDLLARLGIEVLELPPAMRLSDVPLQLEIVGRALGREAEAAKLISQFKTDLARLSVPAERRLRAAGYGPNGYASGSGTLTDELFAAAGLDNVAKELGLAGGGMVSMEALVMAAPDLLVTSAPNAGASRAEAMLSHPALAPMVARSGRALLSDADWVCGLPQILSALGELVEAREALIDGLTSESSASHVPEAGRETLPASGAEPIRDSRIEGGRAARPATGPEADPKAAPETAPETSTGRASEDRPSQPPLETRP